MLKREHGVADTRVGKKWYLPAVYEWSCK